VVKVRRSYTQSAAAQNQAVIRVYDESGKLIEVHRHKGDFKEA